MSWTGLDFYNRLSELCTKNGTTITSFLKDSGKSQSSGTYMKRKATPDSKLVALASERFGVSVEWLLGLTDSPILPSKGKQYVLDDEEASLIDNLRITSPLMKKTVLSMAKAALAPEPKSSLHSTPVPFLAPKDDIIHHEPRERRVRKRVLGRAAAGLPLETVEEFDTYISVPAKYKGDRYFAIQAAGDSMIGLDINNGDYCLFDSQAYRDEGAIMYVQVEGMADGRAGTIKRVYLHLDSDQDGCDAQIELRSANPAYAPMFYPATCVETNGVLALVISPDI